MTVARKNQIIEGAPGFFHCYSRCTQQQFLCGVDTSTGHDHSHRRGWIVERIAEAAQTFAIDVYGFAILENHFHVVFYVDPERAFRWSDEEVVARWHKVYDWQRVKKNTPPPSLDKISKKDLKKQRKRLGSVSWMMKAIKEPISRRANAEYGKKGNFWDGRFGSTALVDDAAVVAGIAYADLNVVRAKMATTLEGSDFTSIQLRLEDLEWLEKERDCESDTKTCRVQHQPQGPFPKRCLQPLFKPANAECASSVVVSMAEYVGLLKLKMDPENADSARAQRTVTERLGCEVMPWLEVIERFEKLFHVAVGAPAAVQKYFDSLNRKNVCDRSASQLLKKPQEPS